MKIGLARILLLVLFLTVATGAQQTKTSVSNVWVADNGDGTYKNPIIHADYSDPDAVRVGDDFYLTASSFNAVPGLPILHSKDLVNWRIINHVFSEQEPKDLFRKPQHGGGVWAPSIRFHGGEFYIYYADPDLGIYVTKAKDLMKQAGYANGLYTGPEVSMVADNTPPGSDTAKVVAADLAKIGFKTKLVSVTHSTMYTKFCNVPANEPDICPNVGWLPDFHEPQTILDPTFNGKNILPSNNSNWPLLNDPTINAAMDKAETVLGASERYDAGGKIDDQVAQTAGAIPWLWENYPTLFSSRVTPALMVDNEGAPDVAMMSVK